MNDAPKIPRYQIVEEVGSGGMSVVYLAVDKNLGREVAVKVLHRHLAGRKEERSRFRGEAQAVARLRHPGILEIYDYSGQDAAEAYIISEYIRGPTLRNFVESQGMGLPEIGAMVAERIAAALAHAHELGVIHRDVKPENIMIQEGGVIKLTDFGIARMVDRDERMTQTGALLGSPAHMPPEIIAGEPVDHRVDIFSLGTVLYWLACDEMPFAGGAPAEILRRIVDSDYRDPRSIDPRISDCLASIIMKSMARKPEDRYEKAADLQKDLASYLLEHGFENIDSELRLFFESPSDYKKKHRERLISHLMSKGRKAAEKKNLAEAIYSFDRVLAFKPGHQEATEALTRLRRRQVSIARTRIGAGIALLGLMVFFLGTIISRAFIPGDNNISAYPEDPDLSLEPVEISETDEAGPILPDLDTEPDPLPSDTDIEEPAETANRDTETVIETTPSDDLSTKKAKNAQDSRIRKIHSSQPGIEARKNDPQIMSMRPVRILLDTWADISIDGERIERDREARKDLPAGRYNVLISREGFIPIEEELEVEKGKDILELRHRLVPRPATIRIKNEQHAAVSINDKLVGSATPGGFEIPIAFSELPDGRFEYPTTVIVKIEKPGYYEEEHRLNLRPGQTKELTVRLEPET